MGGQKYRYATDEQIRDYLASLDTRLDAYFTTAGGLYGVFDKDGKTMVFMDDDDARVGVIIKYLKRIGSPELPG